MSLFSKQIWFRAHMSLYIYTRKVIYKMNKLAVKRKTLLFISAVHSFISFARIAVKSVKQKTQNGTLYAFKRKIKKRYVSVLNQPG